MRGTVTGSIKLSICQDSTLSDWDNYGKITLSAGLAYTIGETDTFIGGVSAEVGGGISKKFPLNPFGVQDTLESGGSGKLKWGFYGRVYYQREKFFSGRLQRYEYKYTIGEDVSDI